MGKSKGERGHQKQRKEYEYEEQANCHYFSDEL